MNKLQSKEYNKQLIEETILKDKLWNEVMKAKKEFEYARNRFNVKFWEYHKYKPKKSLDFEE